MNACQVRKVVLPAVFLTLALLLIPLGTKAQLGEYPIASDQYVNDYAGVLNPDDVAAIQRWYKALETDRGIQAVVVTVNSIADYHTGDTTIDQFAKNLFNTWEIGRANVNDGLLILVAVKDRECWIELGKGFGPQYENMMQEVIDNYMLPYFKKGDYRQGIRVGALGVKEKVSVEVPLLVYYYNQIIEHRYVVPLSLAAVVAALFSVSYVRSGKNGLGWKILSGIFAFVGAMLQGIVNFGSQSSGYFVDQYPEEPYTDDQGVYHPGNEDPEPDGNSSYQNRSYRHTPHRSSGISLNLGGGRSRSSGVKFGGGHSRGRGRGGKW